MVKPETICLYLIVLEHIIKELVFHIGVPAMAAGGISWQLGIVCHIQNVIVSLQVLNFHQIALLRPMHIKARM